MSWLVLNNTQGIQMQDILSFIGSISNAIAAIAAVVTICVTISNYRRDKIKEKENYVSGKRDILYKEVIIDSFLIRVVDTICEINQEMYQIALKGNVEQEELQSIYIIIKNESHSWLQEVEILKFFDNRLYRDVKKLFEEILDTYSDVINKSNKSGYLSKYFEKSINEDLNKIKTMLYEKYLHML